MEGLGGGKLLGGWATNRACKPAKFRRECRVTPSSSTPSSRSRQSLRVQGPDELHCPRLGGTEPPNRLNEGVLT